MNKEIESGMRRGSWRRIVATSSSASDKPVLLQSMSVLVFLAPPYALNFAGSGKGFMLTCALGLQNWSDAENRDKRIWRDGREEKKQNMVCEVGVENGEERAGFRLYLGETR